MQNSRFGQNSLQLGMLSEKSIINPLSSLSPKNRVSAQGKGQRLMCNLNVLFHMFFTVY